MGRSVEVTAVYRLRSADLFNFSRFDGFYGYLRRN